MKSVLVTLFLAAFAASSHAGTVPGPAGLSVYMPDGWKAQAAQQGSEAIMLAVAPGEEAAVLYAVAEAKNADAAFKQLDAFLGTMITDAKVTKGGKVTVNGMPGLAFGGTAVAAADKKPVTVAAVILQVNDTHVAFVVGMAHTDVKAKYKPELTKALAGTTKAN